MESGPIYKNGSKAQGGYGLALTSKVVLHRQTLQFLSGLWLEHGPLGDHACLEIAPQLHQELARQRHDPHSA